MLYDKKWEIKDLVKPKLAGWQQVLLNAADLIEKKGWIRGVAYNEYGYCAVGAILFCKGRFYSKIRAQFKLRKYLKQYYGYKRAITRWNDFNFLGKPNVIHHLREAAKQ